MFSRITAAIDKGPRRGHGHVLLDGMGYQQGPHFRKGVLCKKIGLCFFSKTMKSNVRNAAHNAQGCSLVRWSQENPSRPARIENLLTRPVP